MNIRERALLLFWRRVTPGEVIRLQRFVAPGYRLTGSIIALGDKRGWVLTPDHPNSVAPSHVGLVGLGAILFVVGAVLAVNWFRRSRPVSLSR